MATQSNPRKQSKYPQRFNQRENKASTSNNTLVECVNESYTIATASAANYFRTTDTCTITLPPAAENKGRCIKFFQTNTADLTLQGYNGETVENPTAINVAGNWAEYFCDGTEWVLVAAYTA